MLTLSSELEGKRDLQGLTEFLDYCSQVAREDAHFKIASITLEVDHIDPLAVLEQIYEPNELHLYVEHPALQLAVAGAEAIVSGSFSGKDRFDQARRFGKNILRHCISIGDVDIAFGGPHFLCSFTFFDDAVSGDPFPSTTVFLPRWQVSRRGGVYATVANVRVDPECDPISLADKVWRAHRRLRSFSYGEIGSAEATPPPIPVAVRETGENGAFENSVRRALERIDSGTYEKIVLARAVDLQSTQALVPLASLNALRIRYPGCYAFSVGNGDGYSFIGASPERLLSVGNGRVHTEALAGSSARGLTAQEDARLANLLLKSEKDSREHRHVVASIVRRLRHLGLDPQVSRRPELLQLHNVQHLRTPLRADLPNKLHVLDIAAELHPTPAVGGTPRSPAMRDIQSLEGIDRGLYAGALGWYDGRGDGELIVAIRSALIKGSWARAYAGAGIVTGSDPTKEMQETEMKLDPIVKALH